MKKAGMIAVAFLCAVLMGTSAFAQEPVPDYRSMMIRAAAEGDTEAGRLAAEGWNLLLEETESDEPPIDFDELLLLARLIETEAGSVWLREDFRRCVGEVAMNRVDSPEFPDTLEEVVHQEGQYEKAGTREFRELLPSTACVRAALRVLRGERMLPAWVVFQSNRKLGKVHAAYCDRVLGFTYFCETSFPELYETYPREEGGESRAQP